MGTWINVVFAGGVVLGVIQIVFLIRGRKQVVQKSNAPKAKYIWDGKKFNETK